MQLNPALPYLLTPFHISKARMSFLTFPCEKNPPATVPPKITESLHQTTFASLVNPGLNAKTIGRFASNEIYPNITGVMRDAVRDKSMLWPNGRVPYTLSAQFTKLG